jgi:hypothetical protein
MTMTTINRKKGRIRIVLMIAAAIGCSSATLGGALGTLAVQQSAGTQIFA